jgi:hypothetical protein
LLDFSSSQGFELLRRGLQALAGRSHLGLELTYGRALEFLVDLRTRELLVGLDGAEVLEHDEAEPLLAVAVAHRLGYQVDELLTPIGSDTDVVVDDDLIGLDRPVDDRA